MINATTQRGYALLAVLWICTGAGASAFVVSAVAAEAMATSRNRIALTRASWTARGCVARLRTTLHAALTSDARQWDHVDHLVRQSAVPERFACTFTAHAVGARLDINATPESLLTRLFTRSGLRPAAAESAAVAVAARRAIRPFDDMRELRSVRELARLTTLDSVLDVEPGPIALNHAPAPVLALLPGFTERTVTELLDDRLRGALITSFPQLNPLLSPDVPEASARLPGIVVLSPIAWTITVRSTLGHPPVTAVLEVRLAQGGGPTTTVVRRRSWTE